MSTEASDGSRVTRTIRVAGPLDRQDAEALVLEVRRLAQQHGVILSHVDVERVMGE